MPKKVLITGVTGQDGSYMVDFLLESTDYQIYGMVRRASTNNYHNIQHLLNNNRFKLITGDLTDSQSIDNIVKEVLPDYFINLQETYIQNFKSSIISFDEYKKIPYKDKYYTIDDIKNFDVKIENKTNNINIINNFPYNMYIEDKLVYNINDPRL